jgi:hypothetical protein
MVKSKFRLGKVEIRANALEQLAPDELLNGLLQHQQGLWGQLQAEEKLRNENSLRTGGQVTSVYNSKLGGVSFQITTDSARSTTEVSLCDVKPQMLLD